MVTLATVVSTVKLVGCPGSWPTIFKKSWSLLSGGSKTITFELITKAIELAYLELRIASC